MAAFLVDLKSCVSFEKDILITVLKKRPTNWLTFYPNCEATSFLSLYYFILKIIILIFSASICDPFSFLGGVERPPKLQNLLGDY